MCARDAEDWSGEDLDALLDMAMVTAKESQRCHHAGATLGAMAFLAASFEAALLGQVIVREGELRVAGRWDPAPSYLHLPELAALGHEMGWLSEPAHQAVVQALHKARILAVHPGAYVRWQRNEPGVDLFDPVGYEALLGVVSRATAGLAAALSQSLEPNGNQSSLQVSKGAQDLI